MDIKQLKYFMAIVEEGQISRAARRLHIAQPPLSLQLKLLEQELGTQLIERNTKHLKITQAGHALYQKAEQIMGLLNATRKEISEFSGKISGTLAIGSPPGVGHLYMPSRIKKFHTLYPEVNFHWREGNTYRILELLDSRVIEVGIVRLPIDARSYDMIPILDEPWIAVSSRKPHTKQAGSIKLADLADVPLLLMQRQNGIQCHDMVLDEMRKAGIEPVIVCESDNVMALLTLVELGMGVAIVPKSTISLKPSSTLHVMDIRGCKLESSVALVWLQGQHLSAAAKLFVEMFKAD